MSATGGEWPYVREAGPVGTRFAEVRHFAELDSTNRYLADVAGRVPSPGLVAVADHQTAGRGRLGRRWEAPPGTNLLVSVVLCPALELTELHLCTVVVALAAAEACRGAVGLEPALKWPNDLVVGARKLGGILAESVPGAEGVVVVGLGLNVRWPPDEGSSVPSPTSVPAEIRQTATSILRETGSTVEPRLVLDLLLVELDERLAALDEPVRRAGLMLEYRERCRTLGREVRVLLADGEAAGTATDITPEGHLVVATASGPVTVTAGDVVHVEPGA